jgi:hypothetical protein
MKLEQGKTYRVRLTSGAWVDAEFLEEQQTGGFNSWNNTFGVHRHIRKATRYHFRNIRTGRTITLRSTRKIRQILGGAL